jgi:hypothetical protein
MISFIASTPSHPSSLQEIVDGVIILMLGAIGAYLRRKLKVLSDVQNAFRTRKPTEFEPNPPLGFLDQLSANTSAVATLTEKQAEQNGDVKEVKTDIKNMKAMIGDLFTKMGELLERPAPLSKEEIDQVARARQGEVAAQTETIVQAIEGTKAD